MKNYDYLYDKEYFADQLGKDHFVSCELGYKEYKNAYIVPHEDRGTQGVVGGVYSDKYEFDITTGTYSWHSAIKDEKEISASRYIDETVIYIGMLNNVWGHAITDVLRFLWFMDTKDFGDKYSTCKFAFIRMTEEGDGISEDLRKLLTILGVDLQRMIRCDEITKFRCIVVPDECFFRRENTLYFTKEYRMLINKVHMYQKEHFKYEPKYKKVYFSYAGWAIDKNFGEDKLEKFFAQQGYTIVTPGRGNLEEELNILANCEEFASTIGSCAHNSIFLPKHATAVFIPRAFYLTPYQIALDEVANINSYYIDASLSILVSKKIPTNGPFYYYVSENLNRFYGVEIEKPSKYWRTQLKDIKDYLKCGAGLDDLSSRVPPEYYYNQFMYCMEKYNETRVFYRRILKFKMFLRKVRSYGVVDSCVRIIRKRILK